MANGIITPTGGSLRTDVATLMNTALAPFTIRDQWCSAIQAAWKAKDFVAVGADDELVALSDDADWHASRARAIEIQQKLPTHAEIEAAYKAVDQALSVKPAHEEYQLYASKMLDVFGIKGGDDTDAYVEAMAWTLGDLQLRSGEYGYGLPSWIPIPALAKAIKRTWADRSAWDNYGRPPPIPDITELCADSRWDLAGIRGDLAVLSRTQKRLDQIIEVVTEYETEEW